MTRTLLNRTTATRDNALTEDERDAFLGERRIGRLASIRDDGWPHMTLCVDDDPRMTDLTKAPRSVVCFGLATLVEDEAGIREVTEKVELRYLPAEARGPELDELLWFEGRVAVEITPVCWLAWDQGKG